MTIKILQGDCIEVMRKMDAESVDCVVTSPPYWGLRDYGVDGQMGLEPTLGEHLEVMVNVFAEIHRILKPTGTVWLNYGDCYATTISGHKTGEDGRIRTGKDNRTFTQKPFSTIGPIYDPGREKGDRRGKQTNKQHTHGGQAAHRGRIVAGGTLKPKDLCMIPNRLAIALQDWGWWVRSEIIWAKPNPMPESITDRPATSHEKIFLLTKSAKYFYDNEAVKEETVRPKETGTFGGQKALKNPIKEGDPRYRNGHEQCGREYTTGEFRNLRNVWHIGTKPFSEAHFATFPPQLAETCIKAGCPEDGVVFDPFGGAGTTGLVADQLQREAILIELNPEYIEITKRRLEGETPMFTDVTVEPPKKIVQEELL